MRRYMRRGMTGREKRRLLLFLVCAALIALAVTAMTQLRPILTSLATARVSNAVTRVVNTSVNETLYDAGVDYDRLISLEKDNEGHITAVKSNMAEFNRLQSAVLAGRGPLLHIKMQSVGSSSAHFENAFASAGINQTRHEIRLVVDVYVSVLLPGFSTVTKVTNRCAVAETVIVGSVPDTYTYFDTREDMSSTAEDFIMNNAG